ncbi:O-antigen ligase family protein [Flavobacterium sp. S87F.05.LMB.W.Kidney.N]|uniref:O-antigen ligase family protein n=1 Tax=Flavobacterium sp. S87F.05.LMB.W.Kidney.N TaxID=1278758 RepID=UPI001066A13D|nr:O-antigen ligase family protein [Flavobacterium sp. S87F.05.LMB.W.Kidney.N]TDX13506.1 O-antigen ligase [Flavobacterium sp. S87F.05.LMB.W.Kidney.N]
MKFKALLKLAVIPVLYLLAISPIIYYLEAIQSLLMILSGLFLLFLVRFRDFKVIPKNAPFIASFFILAFYYLFYFSNHTFKLIGESFLLFIAPLFSYYLYRIDSFTKNIKKIQFAYSAAVSALCLYFIVFYINDIPNHHFDWYLARYNLEFYCKIHGTYICLWIGVAILFLFDYVSDFKKSSKTLKGCSILMLICLFAGLIIYNSRNILLGLFIVVLLRLAILKREKITISIKQKISIAVIILLIILLSQRYLDAIDFLANDSFKNSTRYASWTCSLKLIYDSHFFGMDYNLIQQKLNECYVPFNNFELKKFRINSHNQYLDFLLKGGLLLFCAFIWSLFVKLKETLQQKQYLYFSVTVLFAIAFITENILVRQYGIYIYFLCDILLLGALFRNKDHGINEVKEC